VHNHICVLEIGSCNGGIDTRVGLHGIHSSHLSLQSGGVDESLFDGTLDFSDFL